MEYSVILIILFLLIIMAVLVLNKKTSIAEKASKPENQESEKSVSIDRKCEICNQSIPKERLEVVPDSVLCFSCQTLEEKKKESFSSVVTDEIADYDQNHFDPYDDTDDEENRISDNEKAKANSHMGLEAYKRGDYIEARKCFQISGDYYYLGLIYENGLGVNLDYQEAAKYYWEASNNYGMASAQIRLGRMYQDGRGVKKSSSGALKWYQKAKESCKKHEQNEILGLIASNIKDMEEDKSLQPEIKIEFYDQRNYELDILSVAAGKTKDLIDKYHIHSCPNYYAYKRTKYITFRAGDTGEMDALYEIKKILIIPNNAREDLNILKDHGLSNGEVERLINYMRRNPFPDNYRYYILSKAEDLSERPRPSEINARTIYYSLNQLLKDDHLKKMGDGGLSAETEWHALKANLLKDGIKESVIEQVSNECLGELYENFQKLLSYNYNLSYGYDADLYYFNCELEGYIKNTFKLIADHNSRKRLIDEDSDIFRILKKHKVIE